MKIFNKVYYIILSIAILINLGILIFMSIANNFYEGSFNIIETASFLLLIVILQNLVYKDIRKE